MTCRAAEDAAEVTEKKANTTATPKCGFNTPSSEQYIFIEYYSLFIGINVYLPGNIVRIFVEFNRIFVRIFVV